MEEKWTAFVAYMDEQIALCAQRADALRADARADEANFEKIRSNIYDVFRTVARVAQEQCGQDAAALRRFFAERLEKIPASWHASLQKAEAHRDADKAHIEHIKLDTVRDIGERFARIWEAEA